MKEKYGSDAEEDEESEEDSEEAESEDEDGEELTPAVDAAIFRTLAKIKRKDPSIYEQGKDVFDGAYNIQCNKRMHQYEQYRRGSTEDGRTQAFESDC